MKKFGMLVLVSLSLAAFQNVADAANSPSTRLKATTNAVTGNMKSDVKKGFYGRSSAPEEEQAPVKNTEEKNVEMPEISDQADTPVNPKLVKANQVKDNHLANGIQYYKMGNFDLASNEFRKALSYGKTDPYIATWLKSSDNIRKIKELGIELGEFNKNMK